MQGKVLKCPSAHILMCILKGSSLCSSKRSLNTLCLLEAARIVLPPLAVSGGDCVCSGQCAYIPPIIEWVGRGCHGDSEEVRFLLCECERNSVVLCPICLVLPFLAVLDGSIDGDNLSAMGWCRRECSTNHFVDIRQVLSHHCMLAQ